MTRTRGRPKGTVKNDAPFLADVADILFATPGLKPTAAMRRVMRARADWDSASPEAMRRRLQSKWKASGAKELAEAKRRAERVTSPKSLIGAAEIAAYLDLAPEIGVALKALRSDLRQYGAAWRAFQGDLAEVGAVFQAQLEAIRGPFTALEACLAQYSSEGAVNGRAVRTALGLA